MFAFRRILTVLVIAVLASGALSSPVLRHSHAMSEHADTRHPAVSHSHGHSHAHYHRGRAHRHGSEAEPAVEHLHVVWIGIGLTLPASSDDSSDCPTLVGEWVPLLSEMIPPQAVAASDVLDLDSWAFAASAIAVVTPACAEPFVPPKISWLCDTARRERSGVLNI
ncbi:MAG: hypothetical protein NT013_30475 [Planctomycetia bacterium]|nr:hypothetical protein [Planctomycetia bacterium]